MKHHAIVLLLICVPFFIMGQDDTKIKDKRKSDSINSIVNNKSLHDTIRINAVLDLCKHYESIYKNDLLHKSATHGIDLLNRSSIAQSIKKIKQIDFEFHKGIYYERNKNYDLALEQFTKNESQSIDIAYRLGTARAQFYLGLIHHNSGDYKKSITYIQASLRFFKNTKHIDYLLECYHVLGLCHGKLGDFQNGKKYLQDCLKLAEKENNKSYMAKAYGMLGTIHSFEGDSPLALKYWHKSNLLLEEINDLPNLAISLQGLGNFYAVDTIESKEYLFKSIEIGKQLNSDYILAQGYYSLGVLYGDRIENPKKALQFYFKALQNYKKSSNDQNGVCKTLSHISYLYFKLEDFKNSETYNLKSLELAKKNNYKHLKSAALILLGKDHQRKNDLKTAIQYCKDALKLVKNENLERTADCLECLSLSYKKINDFEKALYYFEKYQEAKGLLFNEDKSIELGKIKATYKFEKEQIFKEKEIEILKANNTSKDLEIKQQASIIYTAIGFLILVLAFGFIWYGSYKNKQKLKETTQNLDTARLQQRFLRTQLNPHFFFHALTSIEGYIYNNERNETANFLQSFSKLMRNILESSDVDFAPLQEDINFITRYLQLQQLNHDFKFNYVINIAPDLNISQVLIPPMLTQPLVENAILHGALSVEKGMVSITYSRNNNNMIVEIKDNGKGTSQKLQTSNKLYRSMSMAIVKDRIKNLKKIYNTNISYTVLNLSDNSPESGTSVVFTFPIKYGNLAVQTA